jgi:hypothetical protein
MLEKDDEAARKARAEALMVEIDRLTSQQSQPETKETGSKDGQASAKQEEKTHTPESPRDFIHRRMRELDERRDREDQN